MEINNNLTNPPKRIQFDNDDWVEKISRPCLMERWKEQDLYINYLETRLNQLQQQSTQSNEFINEKEIECQKLKSLINYRCLTKTSPQQTLRQIPTFSRLRQTYLDSSINLMLTQMRDEIDQTRKSREDTQNAIQKSSFTSDSKIGKMLMARCNKLIEENQQTEKLISSDNVAKFQGEIALQNHLLSNLKDLEKDREEIVFDSDREVELMSTKLIQMRNQLIDSHREINRLKDENNRLKDLCEPIETNHPSKKRRNSINRTTSINESLEKSKSPISSGNLNNNNVESNLLNSTQQTTRTVIIENKID